MFVINNIIKQDNIISGVDFSQSIYDMAQGIGFDGNFTGVTNFPFADKASFIAYYGAASVSADTKWIDGSSILS